MDHILTKKNEGFQIDLVYKRLDKVISVLNFITKVCNR